MIGLNCQNTQEKVLKVTIIDHDIGGKTTKTSAGSNAIVTIGMQYASEAIILPEGLAYSTDFGVRKGDRKIF